MKKMLFYFPTVILLFLYMVFGCISGFGSINLFVWLFIVVLFLSAVLMNNRKWFGCIGGLIIGCVLIYMSTQYTGQIIDIERPLGIVLCIYYLVCGIVIYKRTKIENNL